MTTPTTTISAVIHGESKSGKSWLAATLPKPLLYLNAESRAKFVPLGRRVNWEPQHPIPTGVDGDTTVMVKINDLTLNSLDTVYQWLAAGQHPFKSVVFDSITEVQKRYSDAIGGGSALQQQHWGELLRKAETIIRRMRDLADAEVNPVNVLFICGTDDRSGVSRPMLAGALARTIPYHVDLLGFLSPWVDPAEPTVLSRCLHIQPTGPFVAGDGTDILTRAYGPAIGKPNFTDMLNVLDAALGVSPTTEGAVANA